MRVMIDTNIILDVFLERVPFYRNSKTVLDICEEDKIECCITASTVTDIFYLIRKALNSTDKAYDAIEHILDIVKTLAVTDNDVQLALIQRAKDFEDCLLAVCAKSNKCDCIITRNKKDFLTFGVNLYSPEEFLEIYE